MTTAVNKIQQVAEIVFSEYYFVPTITATNYRIRVEDDVNDSYAISLEFYYDGKHEIIISTIPSFYLYDGVKVNEEILRQSIDTLIDMFFRNIYDMEITTQVEGCKNGNELLMKVLYSGGVFDLMSIQCISNGVIIEFNGEHMHDKPMNFGNLTVNEAFTAIKYLYMTRKVRDFFITKSV